MADRSTWLQDYTRHSKGTDQDKTARKVFDALENCELLKTKFQLTDTQSRAIFVVKEVPDFELIRVVVRLDEDQVFVAYNSRAATNMKWPNSWERDFETCLGIEPRMGAYIVKWCVQSHDNTDRLIQWLISKAKLKSGLVVSEPPASTNLETSVVGNDGDSNAPDGNEGDLRADVKTEVIKPSAVEANKSAV